VTSPTINQQIEKWLCSRVSSFQTSNRPFITLCYAQSWDGSITTRSGESLSFSGEESTQLTHQLRSLHDGILVGIGTVLSDDPQLTVRQWSGSNPQPIVLDSSLRTPRAAKICHHPDKQCWILTVRPGVESHGEQVDILAVDSANVDQQQVPLEAAMSLLKERGIKSLMVEGGATVITAFLKARLADALVLTVAPRIVGGYKAVGDLQAEGCDDQLRIHPLHCAPAGSDLIVWGDFQYGGTNR
jgi:diaminohydroxyphosphoribosylaminopyrimidine deaminase/5-amino-6-(5-phosphoribosylamino)uracil reductase|tara:strand:- start:284 stop:1012 length:729 start_codon:yes stop_codon:yes gene_type:complete